MGLVRIGNVGSRPLLLSARHLGPTPRLIRGTTAISTELRLRGLLVAPLALLIALLVITPARDLRDIGSDLPVYLDYGRRLLGGAVPYRAFPLEYPPLALVPMTLPVLVWPFGTPTFDAYAWLFTIAEGIVAVAGAVLLVKVADRPVGTLAAWSLLVITAGASIAWRYDLWPAVLVLAGVVAAERGRPGLAGLALGTGAMMKIFPIVLVPILAARAIALGDRAGLGRLLLGAAVAVLPIMALTLALSGTDALHWLTYQLDRGLQIESVGAGLLLLLHAVVDHPLTVVVAYSSLQVSSPGADTIVAATPFMESLVVLGVCGLALVRFHLDARRSGLVPLQRLATAGVAVLVALVVTSKVFSVQYIVWFLPLAPLLPVRQRWLVVAIAAVSSVVYPLNYTHLWQLDPLLTVVLNVRNLLLVILLGWLALDLTRDLPGESPAPRTSWVVADP